MQTRFDCSIEFFFFLFENHFEFEWSHTFIFLIEPLRQTDSKKDNCSWSRSTEKFSRMINCDGKYGFVFVVFMVKQNKMCDICRKPNWKSGFNSVGFLLLFSFVIFSCPFIRYTQTPCFIETEKITLNHCHCGVRMKSSWHRGSYQSARRAIHFWLNGKWEQLW